MQWIIKNKATQRT